MSILNIFTLLETYGHIHATYKTVYATYWLILPLMSSLDSNLQWSLHIWYRLFILKEYWNGDMVMIVLMMVMMTITMRTMRLARVLIAFNLNQIVIRVNQVATTGDQDCRCKIRELATNNGISFPNINFFVFFVIYQFIILINKSFLSISIISRISLKHKFNHNS